MFCLSEEENTFDSDFHEGSVSLPQNTAAVTIIRNHSFSSEQKKISALRQLIFAQLL